MSKSLVSPAFVATAARNDKHQKYHGVWRALTICLLVFLIGKAGMAQMFQFAPPALRYSSIFFKDVAKVELAFAQRNTKILYTLNGKDPGEDDNTYTKPISIKKNFTTIKALVSGPGFLNSEISSATFIKTGLPIRAVEQSSPDEQFQGSGPNTLIDNKGGNPDLHSKTWLGYRQDSVEINILMERQQHIASVLLNFLVDHGGWIFLPARIQVFYFDDRKNEFQLFAEQTCPTNSNMNEPNCRQVLMAGPKSITTDKIRIVLDGIKSLPEGHPGKGQHGWIFIDEVKCY